MLGLTQTDVKRMIAYSSIAHAGFLLIGAMSITPQGVSGTLFYLLAYGFTTLAVFGVISLVRDADGEATHLSQWAGLAKRSPLVAGRDDVPAARPGRHPADQRLHRASSRCSRPRCRTAWRRWW